MQYSDVEEFKYPRRKPWLLILLLAVIGFLLWDRLREKPEKPPEPPPEEGVEAPAEAGGAPVDVPATWPPSMDAEKLMSAARSLEARGKLNEARRAYLDVLKRSRNASPDAEKRVAALGIRLVLTPEKMPEKVDYVVKRGDSLERIARKYHTTVDLIMKSNRLMNPHLIKAGDNLRVFTATFDVTVSKKRNELLVKMNDEFFKRYSVGTGKFGKTPLGTFVITEKIKEPVWWRPDGKAVAFGEKDNILGTRWMTLRATGDTPDVKGYGIHGTWDDASIGKAESAGCVRMLNKEVEELFVLLPYHTPVVITE